MDAAGLRAMQAPIKDKYKTDAKAAMITLKAKGTLDDSNIACKVETGRALAIAGLHPATGGSGLAVGRRATPRPDDEDCRNCICMDTARKQLSVVSVRSATEFVSVFTRS